MTLRPGRLVSRVFPPVADVLLRHVTALAASLRSAHASSVVLLAAALLLPLAQTGRWLAAATEYVRAAAPAERLNPVLVVADPAGGSVAESHRTAHGWAATTLGHPPRLGSPGLNPLLLPRSPSPDPASGPPARRELERGPPFLL